MIKYSINQDITIVDICAANNIFLEYMNTCI